MTEIYIDMRELTGVEPDDALGPHRGRFKIYPFALLYRSDHFVTKQALSILIDGTGSVFLPPTLAAEGMVFDPVGIPGLGRKVFAIPDSPTAINFVDLVELDPATLDPTPDVIAAWQAALAAFDVRLTASEGEIDALQIAVSGLGTMAAVDDAPIDGTLYARRDGAWVQAATQDYAEDLEILVHQGI